MLSLIKSHQVLYRKQSHLRNRQNTQSLDNKYFFYTQQNYTVYISTSQHKNAATDVTAFGVDCYTLFYYVEFLLFVLAVEDLVYKVDSIILKSVGNSFVFHLVLVLGIEGLAEFLV